MALGPETVGKKRAASLANAETLVDKAIAEADSGRVIVPARLLGIRADEWDRHLAPKYRAAGWKKADWVGDQRDGDFIDIQS